MAQKYLIQVTDDLDGTELDRDDVQEVRFGLDGKAYAIDLSPANATKLRDTLARYTAAARRDQVAVQGGRQQPSARAKRADLDQVRAWANEHGHPVSARGRVPNDVLTAYDNR